MRSFVQEFSVCNKFFLYRAECLQEIQSQVAYIHSIAIYLDDNINVLHIKSTRRIEKDILEKLRGLGVLIKLMTAGEVDSSERQSILC